MCGSPDLERLLAVAYPSASLLRHAVDHFVPITLTQGIDKKEGDATIRYETHAFACNEAEFIHADLAEQVQAGYVAVFPLEAVTALQNLWF